MRPIRSLRFGDVVEWDIESGKRVIRWFVISGTVGNYRALHVATIPDKGGKKWEYEDGRVTTLGVGGNKLTKHRILND